MKNFFIFLLWIFFGILFAASSFASAILLEDAGKKYSAGDYTSAMTLYLQVLTADQDNQKAKKGLRETALKLLEKENQSMANEPSQLMKEAKKALKEAKKQKTKRNKEIKPIYKSAKDDYVRKNYIWASNKFMDIMLKYPDFEKARIYYDKIFSKMSAIATKPNFASFEQICYAKGYVAFQEQRFEDALCEWEKVLQINPEREEIKEQILKVKAYLKNAELIGNEKKLEQLVKTTFEQGKADYDSKNWISCIKKMEKVQAVCSNERFPKALEWAEKAKEYIKNSIQQLSVSVKKREADPSAETESIDFEGAEQKYNEGLILYAQGKIFDAINMWEIAARLNPGLDKAKKAIERAKEELRPTK